MKKTILSLAATLLYVSTQAQSVPDTIVGEVVNVTATKSLSKQSETGKVVTVISKEQIEKSAGKTLAQLLNEQVGVTIAGALNTVGTNQSVFVRGANSGRTLILLDGIPVNDPSLINNEFDLNLLSLGNVESIEICKGGQSTLYGSDAVAGVINIITTKNDITKPVQASATVGYGSFNTFRGNVQLFGTKNKFTYTIRVSNLNTKGFSAAYDSTGTKNYDNDKYNGTVISTNLKYAISEAFSLKAFAQSSTYKNSIDAGIFSDEKDFTVNNVNTIAGTGFTFKKSIVSLVVNYQYSDIKRNYINDSIDKPGFSKYVTDDYFGKNQFAEMYANINLGGGFSLLQGADFRFNNMNSKYYSLSSFGPFTSITKDSVQSQTSAYASLFYKTKNNKFTMEVGGRLNVHSRYGFNNTYTINPSYQFNKNFRTFASLSTGYKAPSLYQLYSSYGNLNLKAEESKNYEIGIQHNSKYGISRAVYFNREINNGIDFNNISFKYFNVIRQIVRGVEFETSIKPTAALTISLNYTGLKMEEKSQSRQTFRDTTYTHLLRRPTSSLNTTILYQINKKFSVSVNGKAVGNRYDVGGYKKQDIKLDSYFLFGANAQYQFNEKIKVFADAQNIGNVKFFDIRGFNSIPFLLNAGVTFKL
jgi:vitamin B12 transporter